MRLDGKHIVLCTPELKDAMTIFRWENDPVHWLVSNTVAPYSLQQINEFIEHGNDLYADQQMRLMIVSVENEAAGCIDLYDFDPKNRRVGVGILIDDAYRGKGYGHDALEVLTRYCFDQLDVHSVYAEVLSNNPSSQKLFEACGFSLVGTKKDWVWDGQGYLDQMVYQRLVNA